MKVDVLIIGAGPSGLTAALLLSKLGVSVKIIDKNESRTDKSKALGVQAGTLECLKSAIGDELVNAMIKSGRPAPEMTIHIDDRKTVRVDLSLIPSQYNYILILEQSETERILEEHLEKAGIRVEREHEFVNFKQVQDKCISQVRSAGKVESVESAYVLGCDGAHSILREQLGISFDGLSYTGDFILADVKLNWPYPLGSMHTFITERGVIACFPMREGRYRLIMVQPEIKNVPTVAEISQDELVSILKYLSRDDIKITETFWRSRFRVHHRMVQDFQKGRAFLIGDAAHIHSPVGGQGMNTGIQDALNITFKIKDVLKNSASPEILKNYEKERKPVAKSVLRGTDFFTRLVIKKENLLIKFMRREIVPFFARSRLVQKLMTTAISEVSIARDEIKRYT